MAKEKKLEDYMHDWVIVHNIEFGQKRIDVGKLADVNENGVALDTFNGSFGRGCLASLLALPYNSRQSSIYRIYNKECKVIYENPNQKK